MKTRVIIWWMLFAALFFHSFQIIDINIAITKMVGSKRHSDVNGLCQTTKLGNSKSSNISIIDKSAAKQKDKQFDWTEQQQNWMIGAQLWFQFATQMPGGMLSQKFGAKVVIGYSVFLTCLLSATIPFLANIHPTMVIGLRAVQGIVGSIGLPVAVGTVVAHWAPPDERGKFMGVTFAHQLGLSIGYALFGAISGYLSWEYVFYTTAVVGAVWFIFWCFLVYDTPDQHPRISENEKSYIRKSLANVTSAEKLPIPWKEILTSVPFAVNIFCSFGQLWSNIAMRTYLPMYLKTIHGLDSKTIGVITGLLYLSRAFLHIASGIVTDAMLRRGVPRTRLRNIIVFFSAILPGVTVFGLLFTKCDIIWSIIVLSIFMFTSAIFGSGTPVALIEMSPNFSGVTRGISYTFTTLTGFFNSLLFHFLSSNFDIMTTWEYFFAANGFINVIPGILFVLFSNSDVQPWNNPTRHTTDTLVHLFNIECYIDCESRTNESRIEYWNFHLSGSLWIPQPTDAKNSRPIR